MGLRALAMAVTTRGATKRKRQGKALKKKALKKKKKAVPVPLPLPHDVCVEIAKYVNENEALAFAMSCKGFGNGMKEALKGRERINVSCEHYKKKEAVPVSEAWIKWAFSMKWEYEPRIPVWYDSEKNKRTFLMFVAARCGLKGALGWLKRQGCAFDSETRYGAARGGHIKVLKYLKSEGLAFDSDTCYGAAEGGHIDVLEYLKSEGAPFDSATTRNAAYGGHIKVLKYLKSEGVPFDEHICDFAAQGGHMDVLEYFKSEGMSFDSYTCRGAAVGGHFNVLQWLRSDEVDCPWDIQHCLKCAKIHNRREMVKWIESFLE